MELHIGATLRSLRKERGITQEELAKALGVTTQAVSKWERSEGYPDITLLPHMAAYFEVTLDTLCGLDEQQKQQQIDAIIRATSDASYEEGVRIAREGLKKFPHSDLLKHNLANALVGCLGSWSPPKEVAEEVVGLYEDILRRGTDLNALSPNALPQLCWAYVSLGESKKAKQVAGQIHGKYEGQRIWCQIVQGEELIAHAQNSIIQTLPNIHFMVKHLLQSEGYTPREKIALCQKMIHVYDTFYECREWPLGMICSYQLYVQIAVLSLCLHDRTACLNALDKAADLALRIDSLPTEGRPSSLLLNRVDFQYLTGYEPERGCLRRYIEAESALDPIRQTEEYGRVMEKLAD